MRFSEIHGLRVRTESGEDLGRVHDLRAELTPRTIKITGLVVGQRGRLERLGIGSPTDVLRIRTHDVVPWRAVLRVDKNGVVVRDGTGADGS